MDGAVGRAAALVAFPVGAAIIGTIIAVVRPPGERTTSGVQHFAAGVVFAAVAGEVLPDLRGQDLTAVIVGFGSGVALLITLSAVLEGDESEASTTAGRLPLGLLVATGVDLLIDGLLVGIGATKGGATGRVVTIALTLEILFLALAVSATLRERAVARTTAVAVPIGLSLLVVVGAIGGAAALAGASQAVLTGVLGFGAAALLYLVVEELLVEAHEKPDTPLLTALFFVGFLALFTLEGVV